MELGGLLKIIAENGVVAGAFIFMLIQQSKVIDRQCATLDQIGQTLVEIQKDYQKLSDDVNILKETVK